MKKMYIAPLVEYLAFSAEKIAADNDFELNGSNCNDGELGWT